MTQEFYGLNICFELAEKKEYVTYCSHHNIYVKHTQIHTALPAHSHHNPQDQGSVEHHKQQNLLENLTVVLLVLLHCRYHNYRMKK